MYQMEEEQVIEFFNIFTIKPNEVMKLDLENIDSMPPELQAIVKAAQEGQEDGAQFGCLSPKQDGSGLESVTKEQYEGRFGEGSWEQNIPEAFKSAQAELENTKQHSENSKHSQFIHEAPTSIH